MLSNTKFQLLILYCARADMLKPCGQGNRIRCSYLPCSWVTATWAPRVQAPHAVTQLHGGQLQRSLIPPSPGGLACVRPWRHRLARRRQLACCCHQPPMDPQLPALHSRLFSPLHKNNEKSVQVVAAMVCPKCKISLPPPYLDDSPVGIFNSSYFSLLFLKRSLLDFGCKLGKARE